MTTTFSEKNERLFTGGITRAARKIDTEPEIYNFVVDIAVAEACLAVQRRIEKEIKQIGKR